MSFVITTSPIIENKTITQYIGPIISSEVFGVNVLSDITASFSDFFGGASGTYRSKLEDLKSAVISDLKSQAIRLKADAIIGFSIAFNEVSGKGKQMFMATATGTAVKLGYDRLEYARKMHELKLYHTEGILTDSEYKNEMEILKSNITNVVAIEAAALEAKMQRQEYSQVEESKRKEESEARMESERLEYQKKFADIFQIINDDFVKHKGDIGKLHISDIDNAIYDDIMPDGNISHYDLMRYFVAIGRADAACKFYIDKFNLTAQDAIQYLLAI